MRPSRGRGRRWLPVMLLGALAWLAWSHRETGWPELETRLAGLAGTPLRLVSGALEAVTGRAREVLRREHLRERVAGLEARVAELELERAGLLDAAAERDRLGELLGLPERPARGGQAARVIAADPSAAFRSIVIDVGTDHGVAAGAAVVAKDGLVGRVLRAGARTSVVQLIDDPTSGVGVLDVRSRVQGVLVGAGRDGCRLKYVPNLEDVRPGDALVASGLDGIYPRGSRVGTVEEVAPGADAFKEVRVRPAVTALRLETVLVLEPAPEPPAPEAVVARSPASDAGGPVRTRAGERRARRGGRR